MAQMKEQIKAPEKELNKIEISKLSDAELKTLVTRMLKELWWGPHQHKDPVRNEGYTNEIKKKLQGNNNRVGEAENQINDLEHKEEENKQSEEQEGTRIQK